MTNVQNPAQEGKPQKQVAREKGWKEIPEGGLILDSGNSEAYETGDWRNRRPIWDEETCVDCMRCWIYCPDSSIIAHGGEIRGIDYKHCKGCGICSRECPVQAIEMENEG